MKLRKIYCGIVIGLLLFIPNNIKAACSNSDKVKLSQLAKNINYTYDYIEDNNSVTFNITFNNIQPNFKIRDVSTKNEYQYSGEELTLNGYSPGKQYRFDVYYVDVACTRDKLASIYISLPDYNPFYSNELCNGIKDYKLCQKWVKNSLSYEESVEKTTKYIESFETSKEDNIEEGKNIKGFYDYVLEFYLNYYFLVLPLIIVGCLIIMYKLNKKNKLT